MINLRKSVFVSVLNKENKTEPDNVDMYTSARMHYNNINAISIGVLVAPQEGDLAGTLSLFVRSFHGYNEKVILSNFFKYISEKVLCSYDLVFPSGDSAALINARSILLGIRKDSRFYKVENPKGELKVIDEVFELPITLDDYGDNLLNFRHARERFPEFKSFDKEFLNGELNTKLKLKLSESLIVDMVRLTQAANYVNLIHDDHVFFKTNYLD